MERYVRFADLAKAGIVNNRETLRRRIRDDGFPPGVKLGPHVRAWRVAEVEAWLDAKSRPDAA